MAELSLLVAFGIAFGFWALLIGADWLRLVRSRPPEERFLTEEEYRRSFEET